MAWLHSPSFQLSVRARRSRTAWQTLVLEFIKTSLQCEIEREGERERERGGERERGREGEGEGGVREEFLM